MQVNASELSDKELDCWVAKAEGYLVEPYLSGYRLRDSDNDVVGFIGHKGETTLWNYSPSTDWAQGGEIIERERIETQFDHELFLDNPEEHASYLWEAWHMDTSKKNWVGTSQHGPTPLIAAMRCYITTKFGRVLEY